MAILPLSPGDLWEQDQGKNWKVARLPSPEWIITVSLATLFSVQKLAPSGGPVCSLKPWSEALLGRHQHDS